VLAAALLLAAGSAWAGGHQDRSGSRSNDSGGGGGRTAMPRTDSSPSSHSGGGSPSGSTSSSGSPGHAVPGGSGSHGHGPNRQPPTQHRGDGGGHHGGGHGGYYGGGYYGGGYYGGYYPYGGYWPRAFWGWYWDDYYYGGPYPYPYPHGGYDRYDRSSRDDMGALDLDVSPERTQVYVDGQSLGKVDDFDGWPQYLWLPKGTYDVSFYLDGYKTVNRQVTVYPGLVVAMDDRMEEGQSVLPPQGLQSQIHDRRDERQRYERERGGRMDRGDDWRQRKPRLNADRDEDEDDDAEAVEDADGRAAEPGSSMGKSGWVSFEVDPEDASVYLDGRFVGTAGELARLQRGLKVAAGDHHLAVVRPGRQSEEKDFEVEAGEETKLSIDLDESD
jgi:hypothetical protein